MAKLYRIKNWDKLFETHDTRKLVKLSWVPIPNKHDGKGYKRIMKHEKAPYIYSAWLLMVQVASKCPTRGVLCDSDGIITSKDLSDKTDLKEECFILAFNYLSSKEIGWIEEVSQEEISRDFPQCRDFPPDEQNRTEQNRTEGNGIELNNSPQAAVDEFSKMGKKRKPINPCDIAFEINGKKIAFSFYQKVLNECLMDRDAAGRIFFRAKCRSTDNPIGWISAGLLPGRTGEKYAFKSIREEDDDPMAVREWIDRIVNRYEGVNA